MASPLTTTPATTSDPILSQLSTLLSTHTQTLADLYRSLGGASHASSILPAKISSLQDSLVSVIRSQEEEAKKEVEDVRNEIEALEKGMENLKNALGDVTDAEAAEGGREGGREQTLLATLSRLKEQRESFGRLEEARRKQFDILYRHLRSYLPFLGAEFYAEETRKGLEDAQEAENGIVEGKGRTEVESDLSLVFLSRLERELSKSSQEVTRRRALINEHIGDIEFFWEELEVPPTTSEKADPASTEPSFDQRILSHICLVKTGADGEELAPTTANLTMVEEKKNSLGNLKRVREELIQELYDKLFPLWEKLDVDAEYTERFMEENKGCGEASVEAYKREHARMLALKAEHMAMFIAKERIEIQTLWDEIHMGEEERSNCQIFYSEEYTEEVLVAHEEERKRLSEEKADRWPVLELIKKYYDILAKADELEILSKDSTRLTRRGYNLMEEEKSRKRVAAQRPKLERELQTVIPQWENERGRPFLVNGHRFIESLVEKLEQENVGKENKKARARVPSAPAPPPAKPIKRQMTGASALQNVHSNTQSTMKSGNRPPSPKRPRTMNSSRTTPFGQASNIARIRPQMTGVSTAASSLMTPCPTGWNANGGHQAMPLTSSHTGRPNGWVGPHSGIRPQMTGASGRFPSASRDAVLSPPEPMPHAHSQLGYGYPFPRHGPTHLPPSSIPTKSRETRAFRPRPSVLAPPSAGTGRDSVVSGSTTSYTRNFSGSTVATSIDVPFNMK